MIQLIDLSRLPHYKHDDGEWIQLVTFQIDGRLAEVDFIYNIREEEWEFSSIYFNSSLFEETKPTQNMVLLERLITRPQVVRFLEDRKLIYDDLSDIHENKVPVIENVVLIEDYPTTKTFQFTIQGSSLEGFACFQQFLSWKLEELQFSYQSSKLQNALDYFEWEDFLTTSLLKSHTSLCT